MAKFLDLTGLGQFKTKIQDWANGAFLKKTDYKAPTIEIVKVNGTALTPDGSKAVNVDLSTYALKASVTQEIAQAVSGIKSFEAKVVESLPETGANGILYLVTNSGSGNNTYDEYLWVGNKYEMLGTRQIDLSGYALKSELPTKVSQLNNDSGFQTAAQVTESLKPYAKTSALPTKTSQLTNDSGFLTAVPDEFVTDEELTAKGYQTAAQVNTAITGKGYQTAAQVETAITGKGYQTAANVTAALAPYAKTADVPTKTSQLTNDANFLTEVPAEYIDETELASALAPYAKTADMPTAISNAEIDGLFS